MGLKRYIRPALAVSVIGHLALFIAGLSFVGADAFHPPPPEAMVVDVVTPDEIPRFEGTPSNSHSAGSHTPSPANGKGPVTQAPPPQPRSEQPQQSQQRPTSRQADAKEVSAPHPPATEATRAELVRTDKTEPEKQNQSSEPQAATAAPTEKTPEQPNIAKEVAEYAALGGPLGGGFPGRRLTPTYLVMTGPRRSDNVWALVRRSRRASTATTNSASRYEFPSTAMARWRRPRACSCRALRRSSGR